MPQKSCQAQAVTPNFFTVTLGLYPVPKALVAERKVHEGEGRKSSRSRCSEKLAETYRVMAGKVVNAPYVAAMLALSADTARCRLEAYEEDGLVARTHKPLTHGRERSNGGSKSIRWEWVGPAIAKLSKA